MTKATYGNPEASFVLIQMVDDHDLEWMEAEVAKIRELTDQDFYMVALKAGDWNGDLSPWPAPAVFGKDGFAGRAEETLGEVLAFCKDEGKTYIIGGYSLAGLFGLWASSRTKIFSGVAAASPSVWFPGFVDYMKENPVHAGKVYLSLGDREEKTRNPVMATVGDRIREAYEVLGQQGISDRVLEWNPGNHFKDADIRTAKAFAWVMNR